MVQDELRNNSHWQIQGWRRRHALPPPPPTGSNSLVFAYVFAKKCPCRRLAPAPMAQCPPPPMGNPGSATGSAGIIHNELIMQQED